MEKIRLKYICALFKLIDQEVLQITLELQIFFVNIKDILKDKKIIPQPKEIDVNIVNFFKRMYWIYRGDIGQ